MCRSILFFTYYKCLPHRGGTERVTSLLAKALSEDYGYECHSAYLRDVDDECLTSAFASTRQISPKDVGGLATFIDANCIDFIVVQGVNTMIPFFSQAINTAAHPCSLIFAIHFVPGDFEKLYISFSNQYSLFRKYNSLKSLALMCTYPLGRALYMKHTRASYRTTAELSQCIVLLSDKYRKDWHDLSGMAVDDCKVKSIPNPCSFNKFLSPAEIETKE